MWGLFRCQYGRCLLPNIAFIQWPFDTNVFADTLPVLSRFYMAALQACQTNRKCRKLANFPLKKYILGTLLFCPPPVCFENKLFVTQKRTRF